MPVCPIREVRRRSRGSGALPTALSVVAFMIAATTAAHADNTDGVGESYWGPIPAEHDSVRTPLEQPGAPAWQAAVDVPYHVIGAPLRLFSSAVGSGVIALDESNVVYRISELVGPRELPYGATVSFSAGGLTGFGGGATLVHDAFFGPDNRFRLGGMTSVNGHHKVNLGIYLGLGRPTALQVGAGYRMTPNARYFGFGPTDRTESAEESFFRREMSWVGATLERELTHSVSSELDVRYTTVGARGPRREDSPTLPEVYDVPFGYGARSDGVTAGASLIHDTTTETGRPVSSGSRRVTASYFTETGSELPDLNFWSYRVELQQFVRLWRDKRVLAFRAYYSWIDPVAGGGTSRVPFQRLMTNDDPDLLRGYEDYRWRDRGMTAFTAEYRWPVWAASHADDIGLDAYLFTDVGQVFGDNEEISADNATTSYGGGLRLVGRWGFVGRIEYAKSEDDTVFRIRADQVFQFAKGGLFHGRNPVPSR